MNIDHGKTAWSPEEQEKLRLAVREIMAADGLSQTEVARRSQLAGSTLSQFMTGSYKGDREQIARDLARWLDARNREVQFRLVAPPEPTFVRTPTATKVWNALQHAQLLGAMVVVVGEAGVGKTSAREQYAKTTPRVLAIAASPAVSSAQAVLAAIVRQHGPADRARLNRSLAERSAAVRDLVEPGSLLVIDEAQHVTMAALEELRSIHDDRKCGFILMGNPTVLSRIEGGARDPAFAQLFSRVSWRVQLTKGGDGDVRPVLESMGVVDPDVIAEACKIARKESLRGVVNAARAAWMLAGASNENLGPLHLRAAYRQLGGRDAA